jgi:hypothetical protein
MRCAIFVLCCAQLTVSQEYVILLASLSMLGEAELDTWFTQRGVNRAEVRAWVRPYATVEWIKQFPRYVEGLHELLREHEQVVSEAMASFGTGRLSAVNKIQALILARYIFIECAHYGRISPESLAWHETRLELESAEAAMPILIFFLPELDDPAYSGSAPAPPVRLSSFTFRDYSTGLPLL